MKKLLTMAVVAAALAFCAPGARAGIGITTNYDALNIALIVKTNFQTSTSTLMTEKIVAISYNNAAILNLLAGPDFANVGSFPAGSKMVASWDADRNIPNGNYGDVLVVDKTGTNVLYDASTNYNGSGNYFYINFFYRFGLQSANNTIKSTGPGHADWMEYATTFFALHDKDSRINIFTYGRNTEHSSQNWIWSSNVMDYTTWSDTEHADTSWDQSESEFVNGYDSADVTATITASGHGKGDALY
jgi:hypothetical protein